MAFSISFPPARRCEAHLRCKAPFLSLGRSPVYVTSTSPKEYDVRLIAALLNLTGPD